MSGGPVHSKLLQRRPRVKEMSVQLLLIGLGGFIGTILRYVLGGVVQSGAGNSAFPWGTLTVNLLGCFGIGLIAELSEARGFLRPEMRGFLMVGVLGGFTTFSAFANETVYAVRDAAMGTALLNIVASVGLGLVAVLAGRMLAHAIWG
jgi:CrcB protein